MQVKTQSDDIEDYLTDASNMRGGYAEQIFIPASEDEIRRYLREANDNAVPVTVSGARTGTVGGAIPFGGAVLSIERLNQIVDINADTLRAVVRSGVILADLQKAVEAKGLFYPPDPTEWSCQIGGTIATNASGARSFKYGATREFVERIRIVLADGDVLDLRRGEIVGSGESLTVHTESGRSIEFTLPTYERPNVRKNVSGLFNSRPFDAIDLFIGSEGMLGVIVEAELRLVPKPQSFFSGIVFFRSNAELTAFVDEARVLSYQTRSVNKADHDKSGRAPFDAALLEYFDDNALNFITEKFPETPRGMAGAVFFEQETTAEYEDLLLGSWNRLLEKHNADLDRSWFGTNEQDLEKMRAFRHALPVSVNERVVRNKQKKVGTDMAVPDVNFASFHKFYREILAGSGMEYVIFGHIGDCHLHANLLPRNDEDAVRARHIYGRCIAQAVMLGGCVSAEHGIGKLKRHFLAAMMGERYLNEIAAIKKAFDPRGILGRGNMLGEELLG